MLNARPEFTCTTFSGDEAPSRLDINLLPQPFCRSVPAHLSHYLSSLKRESKRDTYLPNHVSQSMGSKCGVRCLSLSLRVFVTGIS